MKRVVSLKTNRAMKTNCSDILESLTTTLGPDWTCEECESGKWSMSQAGCPIVFIITVSDDSMCDVIDELTGRSCTGCTAEDAGIWMKTNIDSLDRVNACYDSLTASRKSLNAALAPDAVKRIKDVFKMAQDAVDMPKGFRYTAFRENKEEDMVISTLMYTSAKLNKTQWVMKSALMAAFVGEEDTGTTTGETVKSDNWVFQPNYDPERTYGAHTNVAIKSEDRSYSFKPNMNSTTNPDRQAAYWLVGILSDMIEDILESPPNRVYEFFLADGLLKKKNLALMAPGGLIRLLNKGILEGPEVLKAKPSMWKQLLEKGFITGEQALRSQPNQLAWLAIHDYIPVERALKIDPSISRQLERAGKMADDATVDTTDAEELVIAVADGQLTPQKAWSINEKVLKPLVESKLIEPASAYKLDPSILNWMLENHHIGRAEATKLKPRIKQEMTRKGVDWESLDASKAPEWMDDRLDLDDYEFTPGEFQLIDEKDYTDADGFRGVYYWFTDGERHIFMVDEEEPDPDYADWECDSWEEAADWFDGWSGDFDEDLDSSKKLNCTVTDEWEYVAERIVDDDGTQRHYTLYSNPDSTRFIITYDDGTQEVVPSEDTAIEEFDSYKEAKAFFNDLHSLNSSKNQDLDALIEEFAENEGKPIERLDRISKRISYVGEFDNGHVMHNDWVSMTVKEAEEEAKQASLADPNKTFFVSYDDVMIGSSDIRWKDGKPRSVRSTNSSKKPNVKTNASTDTEFYVSIEYGGLILQFTKSRDGWKESLIYQSDDFESEYGAYSPVGYMGYLSVQDILSYLKNDYPGCQVNVISEEEVSSFLGEDDDWDEDLDSSKKLNASYEDATPENFEFALTLIDSDDSAYDDLQGLAEEVGYTPDDVGGWKEWFRTLNIDDRRTAWDLVSWAYDQELNSSASVSDEDFDSSSDASKTSALNPNTLKQELQDAVTEFMTSADIGYAPDEVSDYSQVEISKTSDGRVRAEVRAELTFDALMDLASALNPIVAKYDRYAYFDAVTSGILDAYIEA